MSKTKEEDGSSKLPRKFFDKELARLQAGSISRSTWRSIPSWRTSLPPTRNW